VLQFSIWRARANSQARCLRQLGRGLDMRRPAPSYETAMDDILLRSLSQCTSLAWGGSSRGRISDTLWLVVFDTLYIILLVLGNILVIWWAHISPWLWVSAGSGPRHSWAWLCLVGFLFRWYHLVLSFTCNVYTCWMIDILWMLLDTPLFDDYIVSESSSAVWVASAVPSCLTPGGWPFSASLRCL
jgi:hypothetical protein